VSLRVTKSDSRLLGAWRSDRRRTFRYFKPKVNCPARSLRKFRALLASSSSGGITTSTIPNWTDTKQHTRYDVLGSDAVSVVIRSRNELVGEDRLQQIHFDGDWYWVALPGGSICEFFRRVPPE